MIHSKKYTDAARGQQDVIARVEMLAAVERLPGSKYRCLCDCGNERVVSVG